MSSRRRTAPAWAFLALAGGFLAAQEPDARERGTDAPATQTVRLWVEVRDAGGRVPEDVGPDDLVIREDGAALRPLTVDPAGPRLRAAGAEPARLAVWFDLPAAGKGTLRRAADALASIVGPLTALGDVDVVMAGEEPEDVLTTRDDLVLGQRLAWASTNNLAEGRVLALRQATLLDALRLAHAPGVTPEEIAERVKAGIDEELELLRERQDQLVGWASAQPRRGPRVLLLVTDGFDLDPLDFYGEHLETSAWRAALRETDAALVFETAVRDTARALAALGWTVLPLTVAPSERDAEDLAPTLIESTDQSGIRTGGAGVTIRPGSLFRRGKDKEEAPAVPVARFADPLAPLRLYAEASGGEVVTSQRGLADAVERYARRFEVAYESTLARDAGLRPLEVEGRSGWTVRAPRWRSRGVPESVAALRLRELLRGVPAGGDLDVAAVLRLGDALPDTAIPGHLEARVQLADLYGEERPKDASFRVTVGIAVPGETPRIEGRLVTGQDLTGLEEWPFRTALEVPPAATEIAVLVEELDLERWGGTRAGVLAGPADDAPPAPRVIEIERPDDELLRGRMRFSTRVWDSRVERVLFQLDERDVAEATRPSFTARLDLGRSPRRQTLTAVAFDAAGAELGRDSVILNAGSGGLLVDIIRPEKLEGTGAVEFEASVAVPVERRLDRVLFFWNSDTVATLFAPPFRQRIDIPPDKPVGYVRVVAMLDDGTVAEDVAFMNGPRAGERIDVNLVELFVVVTNDQGRPVRGLTQDDFRVREQGRDQEIAGFSDAGDLPLTLGMAIDSSASMFVKLPTVQRAAIRFLRSTFTEQDRAFVVDFDDQPRLVRATTHQLESVERSIESLEPSGRTALWESIVYSLVQLQGVRGRKALIVFSDGADEDDNFPFTSCLSFAKKMGVPIYLILMKRKPRESAGLSLFIRSFETKVDRLVASTGGRVFYAKEYENLDEVYDEIETELRSQYLLTYYPKSNGGNASWRHVDVQVVRQGLRPRTLSGYWP